MIVNFKHRGLRLLFDKGNSRGLPQGSVRKLRQILAVLSRAESPDDLAITAFRLHPLTGDKRGYWAIRVTGNYRVVFRFKKQNVCDVDLVDYH